MRVLCAKSRTQMLPHGGFRTAAGATLPSWPRVQACLRPANVTRTSKSPAGGEGSLPGSPDLRSWSCQCFFWLLSARPVAEGAPRWVPSLSCQSLLHPCMTGSIVPGCLSRILVPPALGGSRGANDDSSPGSSSQASRQHSIPLKQHTRRSGAAADVRSQHSRRTTRSVHFIRLSDGRTHLSGELVLKTRSAA